MERKELPVFYSMAELFVYPSKYEGFGLPVAEAMACGASVVTTNVSSLPEVGGDAVTYFNSDRPEELAKKIETLCEDEQIRKKFSQLSKQQAALFTWELTAKKTLEVFGKINSDQ